MNRIYFIQIFFVSFFMFIFSIQIQGENLVLIEAESFDNKGGWKLDQQFMDQMGSPVLLAHGLGTPVEDATTKIQLPKVGKWHVYARTWNWCSPWTVKDAPGLFKIKINNQKLLNDLGKGNAWGWEYAGSINLNKIENTISLHDLTGFEGRCDAILFSQKEEFKIPNKGKVLSQFRKQCLSLPDKPKSAGNYDLVVVGGGIGGLSTAIIAARQGQKVALINDRPILGGNNSSELQVVVSGKIKQEPYPRLGSVVEEIGNIYKNPEEIVKILQREANLLYFKNMHVFAVNKTGKDIHSVTAKHIESSEESVFYAPLFVDCTGNGSLGFLAGADFRVGREMQSEANESLAPLKPDNMTLGSTVFWDSKEKENKTSFPLCDWAIQFTEESYEKEFSGHGFWETGFTHDQIKESEYLRDYLFRAIYGNWAFLKNKSANKDEFQNRELSHIGYILGKRESRRLLGDVIFRQSDIEGDYVKYNDAIVTGTYSIDQHLPDPKNSVFFPGNEFKSLMKHNFNDIGVKRKYLRTDQVNPPYRIPYRCLYSKDINNLFMAGRNISVTHVALCSTRVQGTTGMMGELVGYASTLCKKYNCSPRDIYKYHIEELTTLLK